MTFITSVEELIDQLQNEASENYPKIIKNIRIPEEAFLSFSTWNESKYTRNCLGRTENFELVLLCWNKGDLTPIHDHSGQKCWVYQVGGIVSEVRFEKDAADNLQETSKLSLSPGKLTYMEDRMGYHMLKNETDGRAMTLHLYVEPIDSFGVYNEEMATFESKKLVYDTKAMPIVEEVL